MARGLGEDDSAEDVVRTQLKYLARDPKYESEKPYEVYYDTRGKIPDTNVVHDVQPVMVRNFRAFQNSESLTVHGFSLEKIDCALTASEFRDDEKVKNVYQPVIETLLRRKYPEAAEIRVLEHETRKRHANFPAVIVESLTAKQPATAIHIDHSPYSAARTSRKAFGIMPDQYRKLQTVTIWKSFHGPGNDWPLAVCSLRSINHEQETIAADVVFYDRFSENVRVYHSPKHEWYYFKDLAGDEVLLLEQVDTDLEGRAGNSGVPHASFYNPLADEHAALRESIELRAFLYFK
ncbi:hypothetical protein BKA64DRAFT_711600 [Cadophora sp. MPI-SDFR-AT-0126]|nr:hypothetical protein BKA64DRAFT_711600 [Leotiomycetes sp. MPI-SDFR-AT-0126]